MTTHASHNLDCITTKYLAKIKNFEDLHYAFFYITKLPPLLNISICPSSLFYQIPRKEISSLFMMKDKDSRPPKPMENFVQVRCNQLAH